MFHYINIKLFISFYPIPEGLFSVFRTSSISQAVPLCPDGEYLYHWNLFPEPM